MQAIPSGATVHTLSAPAQSHPGNIAASAASCKIDPSACVLRPAVSAFFDVPPAPPGLRFASIAHPPARPSRSTRETAQRTRLVSQMRRLANSVEHAQGQPVSAARNGAETCVALTRLLLQTLHDRL